MLTDKLFSSPCIFELVIVAYTIDIVLTSVNPSADTKGHAESTIDFVSILFLTSLFRNGVYNGSKMSVK